MGMGFIIGADSNGDRALVVPNASKDSLLDLVKLWQKEAREECDEFFGTINLQCFRTNVQNTAKKWYDGANKQVNGLNPPQTTDHATHDQKDKEGDDVPALPSDTPQAANEDNIFVRENILLYNGKGNKMPFNYVQAKYVISSTTSASNF